MSSPKFAESSVVETLVRLPAAQAHDAILKGLPLQDVLAAVSVGLRMSAADTATVLDVAPRTMQRWRSENKKTLDSAPSNRFYRLMRVVKDLIEEFGTRDAAIDWLHEEQPALGMRRPIDMMRTDPGASSVEDLIGRIRHGVYT